MPTTFHVSMFNIHSSVKRLHGRKGTALAPCFLHAASPRFHDIYSCHVQYAYVPCLSSIYTQLFVYLSIYLSI